MDVAYNQHSPYSRHHASRSHTNLNHLTLAPLTSRLPLSDPDALPSDMNSYSYIEGRSAPTTPSILSRSSSRVSMRRPNNISIPKSKSSTNFLAAKQPRSTATTPGGTKLKKGVVRDAEELKPFSELDRNDSDWMLRAGATLAASAREAKGQDWLASRASSTSLTAQKDEDDENREAEMARERARQSRRGSTAGAFDADDEFSPVTTRRSFSFGPNSRPASRFPSRAGSRRGSRAHMFTPLPMEKEGYFDLGDGVQEEFLAEPDFVDVEEEGFENEEDAKNDEAVVKKLAGARSTGLGGWVERMLGWNLFAVDEDGEETETDTVNEKAEDSEISSRASKRNLERTEEPEDAMPPLRDDEVGGWQDAAWLLSVATKVLL